MKRLKKILKWTGIVLGGLVAIGLVANAVFVWTTDTRLESQLAAIRAAGDPLTLAEMAPKPIPPEKNAATYLRQAKADVDAMENEIYNKDYFDNWSKPWNDEYVSLSPDGLKAVKAAFEAHPNVMPLLERAAACTKYDAGLDYNLPPEQFIVQLLPVVQGIRAHSRVLQFRVYLLLAEGNRDEAVQTGLALLQITSLFDRSPMIISYLVAATLRGIAINCLNSALQSGPVSKDMRDVLDAELAAQERTDGYVWMIKSERASVLDLLRVFPDRRFWLVSRGIWNRRESAVLDWFGRWLAIAGDSDPYRQSEKRIHRLSMQVSMLDLPLLPAKIWGEPADLLPATQAVHNAITRTQAIIRCLRVLNALQIHVSAGSDEVPKLTELGLPAETTTDPYTGEPLHVKKTPQGWLVYSVGRNLQDDGGKLDNPVQGDIGVGPPPSAKSAEK